MLGRLNNSHCLKVRPALLRKVEIIVRPLAMAQTLKGAQRNCSHIIFQFIIVLLFPIFGFTECIDEYVDVTYLLALLVMPQQQDHP